MHAGGGTRTLKLFRAPAPKAGVYAVPPRPRTKCRREAGCRSLSNATTQPGRPCPTSEALSTPSRPSWGAGAASAFASQVRRSPARVRCCQCPADRAEYAGVPVRKGIVQVVSHASQPRDGRGSIGHRFHCRARHPRTGAAFGGEMDLAGCPRQREEPVAGGSLGRAGVRPSAPGNTTGTRLTLLRPYRA
jgi:hypothetical protein